MFIVITIISGLRYGIGYDYYAYLESASGLRSFENVEPIPYVLLELSNETIPFLFFFLSSIFISFFYALGIHRGGSDYYMETFFYVCFPFLFLNQLGIIRQGMATAVILLAITMHKDKLYKRLILIILAYLCHQSALVCLLILFPWEKVSVKTLWALLFLGFISSFVLIPIITNIVATGFLGDTGTGKAMNYLGEEGHSEGQLLQYLVYLIGIAVLLLYHKLVKLNRENAYYISLIILGVSFFALFSFNISLSKRFCMLFFSPAIFVVPQIVKVLRIPRSIYLFVCILLFSLTIYVGSSQVRDGDSHGSSVTYPYRTIFEFLN